VVQHGPPGDDHFVPAVRRRPGLEPHNTSTMIVAQNATTNMSANQRNSRIIAAPGQFSRP
jgi:hypothetical protein